MNIGYLAAGWIFDYVRQLDFASTSAALSQRRTSNCSSSASSSRFCFSRQFISSAAAPTGTATTRLFAEAQRISGAELARRCGKAPPTPSSYFRRLIGQSGFYRLLVFFLFIGFLKAIFLQMDYVFPKWGDRELGFHAPVGKLSAINSIVIILLVPIVGALTQRFAAYRMVVFGGSNLCGWSIHHGAADGMVSGCGEQRNRAMAWARLSRRERNIHPYYIMAALYLIVFSIGEAFYSPRVYEYAAAIAPPGQEASYGSLAYLPFLVGKLLVGTGGWLLAAFCPGTRSTTFRDDVADFRLGRVNCADRINRVPSLHSRARGGT